MKRLIATSLMAMFAAAPAPASAQVPSQETAAAEGHALVLSGGGARGLSHAGALVALEQIGYDPALVVGTSMGAIVGAMYAAGYSPADIWRFVADENWLERFSAEPALVGRDRMPLRPVLGIGIGRHPFEGLLPTTNVNMRLVELLFDAGVRARNDFDALPRRYRAVTADLDTGAEVVLAAGDLPRAVRASMAVPGAFAPVQWDGRILADGGLANNLPVSVAASLTDAPIIAIDVLRPSALDERSSLDLGVRALRLLIANAQADSVAADIVVLPAIGSGYSETRFPSDATSLLEAGRDAVLEQVPPATPREAGGLRPAGMAPLEITGIRVVSDDPAITRLVRRVMRPAIGAYDADTIIMLTAGLYGTALFQGVWPRLEFDAGDASAATLVVEVTPVAGTTTAGAVRWDDDSGGAGWFTLRQRISLITPVEIRAATMLSEIGRSGSLDVSVFSTLVPGAIWTAGAHVTELRVPDHGTHRRAGGWAGTEVHGPVRDWFVSAIARIEYLERDSGAVGWGYGPYFRLSPPPRVDRVVGLDPLVEWEARLGSVEYSRGHVRLVADREIGRFRTAALVDAQATSTDAPADVRPATSRDLAPWLPAYQLRSRASGAVGADVAHPIVFDSWLRLRLRAFGSAATGTNPGDPQLADRGGSALRDRDAWQAGGELGIVRPTFIGPVTAAVAAGGGEWRFNLGVGTAF